MLIENFRQMEALVQKLLRSEFQKMGRTLCVKKVSFHKSDHIYSFIDKLCCLINTVTALLELLTDCLIRVSRSFITKG